MKRSTATKKIAASRRDQLAKPWPADPAVLGGAGVTPTDASGTWSAGVVISGV